MIGYYIVDHEINTFDLIVFERTVYCRQVIIALSPLLFHFVLVYYREFRRKVLLVFITQQAFYTTAVKSKNRGHITPVKFQKCFVKEFWIWLHFDEVNDLCRGSGDVETL